MLLVEFWVQLLKASYDISGREFSVVVPYILKDFLVLLYIPYPQ